MSDMSDKLQAERSGVTRVRRAFVAGATGYTGRALVAELVSRGVAAIAHVRPDSARLGEWQRRFERDGAVVDSSPWREAEMRAALRRHEPDAVFALLGTTRVRGRAGGGRDTYETVDYGLTAMLLRAAREAAPAARFVYLSSMGVGPRARGGYLQVRWRLEQELRDSGLDWTIVRPAFISGPDREERRPLERVGATLVDGLLGVARLVGGRRLHDRYSSLTATELARGLAGVACDPAAARRVIMPDQLRDR
jgi:nucleoside-diphosphate-sugar epimerase